MHISCDSTVKNENNKYLTTNKSPKPSCNNEIWSNWQFTPGAEQPRIKHVPESIKQKPLERNAGLKIFTVWLDSSSSLITQCIWRIFPKYTMCKIFFFLCAVFTEKASACTLFNIAIKKINKGELV